jgi:murein DD-endopeptidase MepM/ murein hydrolase activator NlpD
MALAMLMILAQFTVPEAVLQGRVLRIEARVPGAAKVEFLDRAVPLYTNTPGIASGLVPAPALTPPGVYPMRIQDSKGALLKEFRVRVDDARYQEQNIVTTRRMRSLKSSEEEMRRMQAFRAFAGSKKLWTEPLARPAPECNNSPFGVKRFWDGKFSGNFHAGLDFRSPKGRRVVSASDGAVKVARMFPRQGGTVGLDHGQGLQTTYIHLSRVAAVEGRQVKRGQVIGYVGSTGFSTGAHLHWSVHVHGVPVDPAEWIEGARACGS